MHVQVEAVAMWFGGQPLKVGRVLEVPSGQKVGYRVPQHPAQDRKLRQLISAPPGIEPGTSRMLYQLGYRGRRF